jgi:DNA-binding NtrC family response regulator
MSKSCSDGAVSHDRTVASLVPRLLSASDFDAAAAAVLDVMLVSAEQALSQSRFDSRGRMLRGVMHLRPGGSYQRVIGLECAGRTRVEGLSYVTSGNVWRWIEQHRSSVSIDLHAGALRSWLPEGQLDSREESADAALPGAATRQRMLDRDATHVHVVPLQRPGGDIDGVVTLEASCRAASGQEFIWDACHEELQVLAAVGGAFLATYPLPTQLPASDYTDEYLPVVGQSTGRLIELLRAFAPRDDTILISGPTGSGKSRLARWCHEHSSRGGDRFEHLDLLGIPEDLQLPELFGWKRGAFTGAVRDNPGAIARAGRGTLFLDEIDKLSIKSQAGLLRFIEDRQYRMLGDDSAADRRSDVRLLVGTNADLRAAVRAGRFREDLYYRINVLPVRLPPLSERLDELPLWAEYMLNRRHREAGGTGPVLLDARAVAALAASSWPGNLRQLDNIVRRAYALLLAAHGDPQQPLTMTESYVQRALTFDVDAEPSALTSLLWRAARAFVREVERRNGGGAPLPLEMTEAFRGMVLASALQHAGNRDDAFALLGQQILVKNRNHHRALRRELNRVRDLSRELGESLDPEIEALLDAEPSD